MKILTILSLTALLAFITFFRARRWADACIDTGRQSLWPVRLTVACWFAFLLSVGAIGVLLICQLEGALEP